MYHQQQQQQVEVLTPPHESIVTQEAMPAGGCNEFGISFQDMLALGNPNNNSAYPDQLDFNIHPVDVTGSNYFTYHADPTTRIGAPVGTDMLSLHPDYAYQQHQLPNMNLNMYGSLGSESSGFVPGIMDGGYNNVSNCNAGNVVGVCSRREYKRGGGGGSGKAIEKKEKQRRERLGEKYEMLKALIPNRTKDDRATIVSDAIEYINELCRTVNELKLLVEKKRLKYCAATSASFNNRLDTESSDVVPAAHTPDHHGNNGEQLEGLAKGPKLRSSWLQRKSKEALVDVRIIEDEVNIKITKKKKAIGCLLPVSRAVDDLRLQILNLSGGVIGECHVYMFNTQIMEGSSVYASAVAKKLIEVIDMY